MYYLDSKTFEYRELIDHIIQRGLGSRIDPHPLDGKSFLCCGKRMYSDQFLTHAREHHRVRFKRVMEIRCPSCGEWGAVKRRKRIKCIKCGSLFEITRGAFMDGVFLDHYPLPLRYEKYIEECCKALNLPAEVGKKAVLLLKGIKSRPSVISGKNPRVVSGALVYITSVICGEHRTQRNVADEIRVTEQALRSAYQKIVEEFSLEALEKWAR